MLTSCPLFAHACRRFYFLPFVIVLLAIWSFLPSEAPAGVRVEAFAGQPWGVGRITIDLPSEVASTAAKDDRFAVMEKSGRVLYPVIGNKRARKWLRRFLSLELPGNLKFYFLFQGDQPLDLEIYAPGLGELKVIPQHNPEAHAKMFGDWWRAYSRMYERVHKEAEYPIVVQNYLTSVWARRLGQPMPEPANFLFRQHQSGGTVMASLTADAAYRASIERDLVLGLFSQEGLSDQLLPPPPTDLVALLSQAPEEVPLETISLHVPQESFYLRFGNFSNYLWFRDFLARWKGDLGNMLVLRSINRNISPKIEEQLAIKESKLARAMGPKVIQDVAIIGLDPYFRDGAAFGILFHAKNNLLLGANFRRQRQASLDQHDSAIMETVQLAGHDVSLLSTPDGAVRSFYAKDGDFHLVTNSRRLAERFFQAGEGDRSLGASREFQHARHKMPITRDDTFFAYLSSAFFENLASPRYRIELDRRLRSVGEIRTLRMAQYAGDAEGFSGGSIEDLIAAGLLPTRFGQRNDGSELDLSGELPRDTLRGTPGRFVPVADMPIDGVTQREIAAYSKFNQRVREEVGRFVPLVVALSREDVPGADRQHIALDVRLAPFSQTQLAPWANKLGPANSLGLAPIAGDVVSGEINLQLLGKPTRLFAGLRDFYTPLLVREGQVLPPTTYDQYVRGYIGVWPRMFLLDRIFGPPQPADPDGYSRRRGLLGLLETWHRRIDDFFLFSFQRDVLAEVGPQLAMVQTERPAQIRLHVDDLTGKQLATAVTGLGYRQSRQTSASGSRFMNSLVQQLHVPRDQAREVAESLIAGRFNCPLGGDYLVVEEPGGLPVWTSTSFAPTNRFLLTEIPADYQMPVLDWFRGLDLDVARHNDALTLHIDLAMVGLPVQEVADEGNGEGWKMPDLGFLNPFAKSAKQVPVKPAKETVSGKEVEKSIKVEKTFAPPPPQ